MLLIFFASPSRSLSRVAAETLNCAVKFRDTEATELLAHWWDECPSAYRVENTRKTNLVAELAKDFDSLVVNADGVSWFLRDFN